MHYDRQDATEQPTKARLKRAREEGEVARSSDLSSSLFSLVAIGFAILCLPSLFESAKDIVAQGILPSSTDPETLLDLAGKTLMRIMWFPCLVLFLAAVFSGFIQVGGVFAPMAAKFNFSRIAPTNGWFRIWGGQGWMHLLFSTCKFCAVVLSAGAVCWIGRNDLLQLGTLPLIESLAITGSVAAKMILTSVGSLLLLGVLDVVWQRHQWKTALKMTRQEVIKEHREQEGNADIRKYRRSLFQSQHDNVSVSPSLVLVGTAAAISIRWNPTAMSSPVVLAIFRGHEMEQFVFKSRNKSILVQENHWLCQQIEQNCDVGMAVPPALHSYIAISLTVGRRKIA